MSAFKVEDCIPKWLPQNGQAVKLQRKFADKAKCGPSGTIKLEFDATVDHVKLATGGCFMIELCLDVQGSGRRYFTLDRTRFDYWQHDRIDEGESWDIFTIGGEKILPPKEEVMK